LYRQGSAANARLLSGNINATDEVDINPWVVSTAIAYRF
jgi:outer membrane protein W